MSGQHPKVVVLACSDSRVPPELVFDQGLGVMAVVRTGGEAVDDLVLASVEAGVRAGATLVFVLGHEGCDVLANAVKVLDGRAQPVGHEQTIVDLVTPAYKAAQAAGGNTADTIVTEQIKQAVGSMKSDSYLTGKGVSVVGGEYELDTGKVVIVA